MFVCIHIRDSSVRCDALRGLAEEFSPQYESASPDTAVLDVRGLERIFGSPRRLLDRIHTRAAELGLTVNVAHAANPDTAIYAARHIAGATVIARGEELAYVGKIDVSALPADAQILESLDRWGINTLAGLAALPPDGIASRFGQRGVELQRLARGAYIRPLTANRRPQSFSESTELDHPVSLLEPLLFVIGSLVHSLCHRLRESSVAAAALDLQLKLEDAHDHSRTLRLPVPTADPTVLLKLMHLDLEAHPPAAPILAVTVAIEPAQCRPVQGGIFTPQAPEPEKLEITLARIRNLVGEENVGVPEPLDTHRPDAFRIVRYHQDEPPQTVLRPHRLHLAIRLFRPPLTADVEPSAGPPQRLHAPGIRGSILRRSGPWRASCDWWTTGHWNRDEWDIALSDGALYRIFRVPPPLAAGWFVDGRYD